MKSLFRYTSKEYNDSLVNAGSVRIGTLYDFRKDEHKAGVLDRREGKKTVSHHAPYASSNDPESVHWRAVKQFGGLNVVACRDVNIVNADYQMELHVPDCLIHCTSYEYSVDVLSQFKGADSCVEIIDARRFYKRLSILINRIQPAVFGGFQKVIYKTKDEAWNGSDWAESPLYIKEPIFSPQCEVRAVWYPNPGDKVEPLILEDIEVARYCRAMPTPQ